MKLTVSGYTPGTDDNEDTVERNDFSENVSREGHGPSEVSAAHNDGPARTSSRKKRSHKKIVIISAIVIALIAAIVTVIIILLNQKHEEQVEQTPEAKVEIPHYYSSLTGEEIPSPADDNKPLFCVQVPNGLDGPRPQVGLKNAKVVFEAIAEAGITRFAAVFQDPQDSMIGPIRSLRPYYLDWDIPLGCSVVHAGGSYEALQALKSTNTPEIDESTVYMWRNYTGYYAPNNLFTSGPLMSKWASDNGFTESHPKGWAHLTPEETQKIAADNQKSASETPVEGSESPSEASEAPKTPVTLVTSISVNYGTSASFNTHYTYDSGTNSYLRSYATGDAGTSYTCPAGIDNPTPRNQCSGPEQLSPSVLAVMFMEERRASDNYHEEITTIGSGRAVIFQNGIAIEGTWNKSAQNEQIVFRDGAGEEIKLAVGQLWISAIPNYGSVEY